MGNVKFVGLMVCLGLLGISAQVTAGIPNLYESYATMDGVGSDTAVLFNLPNGGGSSFNEAQILSEAITVDATITLVVLDGGYSPIEGYPAEDMWLESQDGGMRSCPGGTIADYNTDAAGETSWQHPMMAGGSSQAGCLVIINGFSLYQAPLNLYFNSADINGDGTVNLIDVSALAYFYYNEYDFSADFHADGHIGLADIIYVAESMYTSCP